MLTVNQADSILRGYYDDEDSGQYGPVAWANGVRLAQHKLSEAKVHAEWFGLDDDGNRIEEDR